MAFRFRKASCVATGTFNIYVLRPPLLRDVGIITGEMDFARLETNLTQPGFRFSSERLNSTWIIQPDRVAVESVDPKKDCGDDLAKVLDALKFTPLTAVGSNAEYVSVSAELPKFEEMHAQIIDLTKGADFSLEQSTFHFGIRRGEQIFNIQIAKTAEGLELSCNIHTVACGADRFAITKSCSDAARKFFEHRNDAEAIVKRILSVDFEYEHNSTGGTEPKNGNARESA